MTVFGYLQYEPYRSIRNDQLMFKELRQLNSTIDGMMPADGTPGVIAYSESKIVGEQIANTIMRHDRQKSIISIRLGMVNVEDECGPTWARTIWLSHRDTRSFFERAMEAPWNISGTYFAVSNNHRRWMDLNQASTDLKYIPQDGAKDIYGYHSS